MEKKTLIKKMAAIRADVGRMAKEGRNTSQNYDFLSEAQITEAFKEHLDKHGVMFLYSSVITGKQPSPSGKQVLTDVEVKYKFVDIEDSNTFIEGVAAGQGTDPGDKGVYKAITGAIKYVFMKTFMIATGDDPENDSSRSSKKVREVGGVVDQTKPPFGEGSDED